MTDGWSSRFSFWVALIASAVGLGNIWRFSYLLAEYGSLFLLLYFAALLFVGIPMLCLELLLARRFKVPVSKLFSKVRWFPLKRYPALIFALFFVLGSYYAIVVSETLDYALSLHLAPSLVLVWGITLIAVFEGIKGVEKANNFLTLLLVLLLLYLFFTVSAQPSSLLEIPSPKPFIETLFAAVAQVLFSLSVGAGMTYTYATYARKDFNVPLTAGVVAFFDLLIALISAAVVFSLSGGQGIFLAFDSLSSLALQNIGILGNLALFLALFSAGITSLIAIVKVLYDNWGKRAVFLQFALSLFLGLFGLDYVQFLDQYVVTYLFLVMLPVNLSVFYYLAVHRTSERSS